MAPLPQATSSPTPSQQQQSQSATALPGMKRGIAIGIAASVCIILIALLAFYAIRRRRKVKAQRLQASVPSFNDDKECIQKDTKEKPLPSEPWTPTLTPVEADARPIYELDAGLMPEMPTKANVRKAQELDVESTHKVQRTWERCSEKADESVPADDVLGRSTPKRQVPILHISPPEMANLERTSLLGVSPLGVSPLEDAYFPQTPRSPYGWV
ncbi:hypothetical protein K458DRAFT_183636 [Lentithecium fluviatile CBS 122367]|uniref:Mid2 domain-containing protein n=1 Tax=Lentithecium fluviatile CBS 122367 TaxID=1168545 RepID=A0A6G1IDP4_9PLEO|nr:hypothetical protein K458DRAFT_183636 [Lentithecium fluviatile CBS 122367]